MPVQSNQNHDARQIDIALCGAVRVRRLRLVSFRRRAQSSDHVSNGRRPHGSALDPASTKTKNTIGSSNAESTPTGPSITKPGRFGKLTPRQTLFVKHYVATLRAQAIRNRGRLLERNVYVTSLEVLKQPAVAWAIQRHANKVAAKLEFDAAKRARKALAYGRNRR